MIWIVRKSIINAINLTGFSISTCIQFSALMMLPLIRHNLITLSITFNIQHLAGSGWCVNPTYQSSPSFLFSGDFNHSRFVNNACRSVAFLHYTDDPRLIPFLLLYIFTKGCCLLTWECYQQSTLNSKIKQLKDGTLKIDFKLRP